MRAFAASPVKRIRPRAQCPSSPLQHDSTIVRRGGAGILVIVELFLFLFSKGVRRQEPPAGAKSQQQQAPAASSLKTTEDTVVQVPVVTWLPRTRQAATSEIWISVMYHLSRNWYSQTRQSDVKMLNVSTTTLGRCTIEL